MDIVNGTHRIFAWGVGLLSLAVIASSAVQIATLYNTTYPLVCNTSHLEHPVQEVGLGAPITTLVMAAFPLVGVLMSAWSARTLTVMDVLTFMALALALSSLYQANLSDNVTRDIALAIRRDIPAGADAPVDDANANAVPLAALLIEEGRLGRSSLIGNAALWGGLYLSFVFILRILDERTTLPFLEHLWFSLLLLAPAAIILPLQALFLTAVQAQNEIGQCTENHTVKIGPRLRITGIINVVCLSLLILCVIASWLWYLKTRKEGE